MDQIRKIERDIYISVKEHFTELLKEHDRRIEQALTAAKDAVQKAETANERRLNLLNEFRQQSADESQKYALKETMDSLSSQVSKIWGGLIVVTLIGVANLVKLFFH